MLYSLIPKLETLFAILAVITILGCDNNLDPGSDSLENFPIIDPDDTDTIAAWESSPYNFGDFKIEIVKLQFLHGVLGNSQSKGPKSVALHLYDAKTTGITDAQKLAIERLIQDEAAIHATIRAAIYDEYKKSYPAYKEGLELGAALYGGADEIYKLLPEISSGNELDQLIQFGTIYIHPAVADSVSIGLDFVVPWDEEHGIGLRLLEGKVEAIGTGHEAFPAPQR